MKIPVISAWIERAKLRDEENRKADKILFDQRVAGAKQELKDIRAEMFRRPCTLNSGANCFKECVHFRDGYVETFDFMGEPGISSADPRCKLWKS